MGDSVLIAAGLACSVLGFAWLALAMDVHWQQAFGTSQRPRSTRLILHSLATIALLASLLLVLAADHASIASLVWIMSLAAAALVVAFTLAWRPRLLRIAVPWKFRSAQAIDSAAEESQV
jgi:Protein of unknown function (DUF3325)